MVLVIPQGVINEGLAWLLEKLVTTMYKVLSFFEQLPYATFGNIWIEPWHYVLQYLLLLSLTSLFFTKSKSAIYLIVACFMLFLSDRLHQRIENHNINEIRVYNVHRNMAIGFFDGRQAVVLTDSLEADSRSVSYSITPNLNATVRSGDVKFLKLGESYQLNNL